MDFGHFADRGAQGQGVVIGHHAGLAAAITGKDEIDDAVAFIPGKINVNIWRIMSARIEKAFEELIVADRIDMGNA